MRPPRLSTKPSLPCSTRRTATSASGRPKGCRDRWDDLPIRESLKLQFRAEFFTAFNRPQLDNPNGQITNFNPVHPGGFSQISNTVDDNRDIQFGLKLVF